MNTNFAYLRTHVKRDFALLRGTPTGGSADNRQMAKTTTLRQIVANNLRALMKHARDAGNKELASPYGLEKRTGISDDSIARYLSGESPIDVDALEQLAEAYNLQGGWELLYPDFSAAAPPAEELRTIMDLLANRIEAEEAALRRLSGVHGKSRDDRSTPPDSADPHRSSPRSRKPHGHG